MEQIEQHIDLQYREHAQRAIIKDISEGSIHQSQP